MKRQPLLYSALASFCLLAACGPAPTTPTEGVPSPLQSATDQASPSSLPSAVIPTATVSASASASASASVGTGSPSPVTSATPLPTATPDPAQQPVAGGTTPPLDISTFANTTFNGKVHDFNGGPLDDVTVTARSLNDAVPYQVEAKTIGGTYTFNDAPAGVQIEITASKAGYASRRRVEVLKSNKEGDPRANRYDFGTDGTPLSTGALFNALTDSPEVTAVTPTRNSSGIAPNTSFVVTFSKPMIRESVEKTFTVRSFNDVKLSVDDAAVGPTFSGNGNLNTINNTLVWDKNAFNITWNTNSTQATFAFKDDSYLPTDKESSRTPTYQLVFNSANGRSITGSQGGTRDNHHFRLTDSELEESIKFAVTTDKVVPYLAQMSVQTAENGGQNGDAIQIVYSEPLILYTQSRRVAGGMDDRSGVPGSETRAPASHPDAQGNATARNTAKNYQLTISPPGSDTISMSWFTLGGTALYDGNDATRRTVLLLPPTQGALNAVAGGAPLNSETISATALLKNGTTVNLGTLPLRLQSSNGADHVGAGVNLLPDLTETVQIVYTDGSRDINVNVVNPAANTYTALRTALGALTTSGVTDWTITTQQSGGALGDDNVDANDRVNIALNPAATRNGKQIAWVELNGGIFAPGVLNMTGYSITTTPLRAVQATLNSGFDATGGRFTISEVDGGGGLGVLAAGDNLTLTLGANPVVGTKAVMLINIAQTGLFAASRLNTPTGGYIIYPNTAANAQVNIYPPGSNIFVSVASTVMDPAGNTIDTSRNTQTGTST